LLLDADERITPELKEEVIAILKSNPDISGFWIPRINYFMGKRIRFSGWQGDKVIRLFKRDACRYEQKHVHAEIITKGEVSKLKNAISHNTYVSLEAMQNKLDRYAQWQAKDYDGRTGQITPYHTVIKPFVRFIKHYIFQLGILDGKVGYIISSLQANAVKMRYHYLKKIRKERNS
jgi:hypothetical protein